MQYSDKDVFKYFINNFRSNSRNCFLCFKSRISIKQITSKKDLMMDKAIRKLERELDIVRLLTMQRDNKETKQILFDNNDNMLMNLQ